MLFLIFSPYGFPYGFYIVQALKTLKAMGK
nr:MAG TPA: hypothetical protein [Caudoviricetes sp.]